MGTEIIERMRTAFRAEALDLLEELDSALLALEADSADTELVHRAFRAIHTIKGSGATAGFRRLATVAHKLEEALDLARSGRLPITAELTDCGLRACDVLRAIVSADDPEAECPGERIVMESLAVLIPRPGSAAAGQVSAAAVDDSAPGRAAYHVVLRPSRDLFYSGTDPVTLLDELRGLGQAHITVHVDAVPLLCDLDPESCYFRWDVKLVTDRGEHAIREVFRFVEDDCDVSVRLLPDQTSSLALLETVPAESLELFTAECSELLQAVERHALDLEEDPASRKSLDALFRGVHSIKGNAGLLLVQASGAPLSERHPLRILSGVAHALESLLETHRNGGKPAVDPETVALVLEAKDAMQVLVDGVCGGAGDPLPDRLAAKLGLGPEPSAAAVSATSAGMAAFRNTATQCLEALASCVRQLEAGGNSRPVLKTYERSLKTLASAAKHQNRADLADPLATQLRILQQAMRSGEPLSSEDRAELQDALRVTVARIEAQRAGATAGTARTIRSGVAPKAAPAASSTMRIDPEKLDRLMRVVGELIVAKAAFPALVERLSAGEDRSVVTRALRETGATISHIADELQASVMAIRMLPVKTLFQRFPRLVRDLAQSLGKEVQLLIDGESIELDKTILEHIADPLVHLVRNAVDHGIEPPVERIRAGKERGGRVFLRASSGAGRVVIEVEDDGRGLNPEALKRKAVEKGLIDSDAASTMSAAEACRLVFLPGLSTAESVSAVSGRGVGMDVVQTNIRSLQGTVDIHSKPGSGTLFTIELPTSLIVSKGILLETGGQEYILPLTSVRDMVKIPAGNVHRYRESRITQVRGEVYSVFSLAEVLGLPTRESQELPLAVVEAGKVRYGLIVERFVSEVEVLVKPLTGGLENCKEFHGAAILGDGRVVLVLNPLECHRLEAVER